jgi:type III restriction enzyme
VDRRVDFRDENPCELGIEKYVKRIEGLFLAAITPDESQGETPLLPLLNRTTPIGSTADVAFSTTRACYVTQFSHINMVVGDTATWEQFAAFRLEMAARKNIARCYARNDGLGLTIPYEWYNVDRNYEPDCLVRLAMPATEAMELTVVLEIKGMLTEEDKAKHEAARRWVAAVNNWGKLGRWAFHVCRDPQMLERELSSLLDEHKKAADGTANGERRRTLPSQRMSLRVSSRKARDEHMFSVMPLIAAGKRVMPTLTFSAISGRSRLRCTKPAACITRLWAGEPLSFWQSSILKKK